MKSLKKSVLTLASLAALAMAGSANASLQNWYLDTDGAGGNAAVQVRDYIDLTGVAYVKNTFTSPATFTFNEAGLFSSLTADGPVISGGTALSPALDAFFTGSGNGTVGGQLTFTPGGTLVIKSGVTTIGNFELLSGSANLNAGTVLPNGAVSFIFKATSLLSGYFFNSGMTDLSTLLADDALVFGFGTTNVIPSLSTIAAASPLITLYNSEFDDVTGPITPDNVNDLNLSNNGQFRLEVPEPGSLALIGIGLLGFAGARRRKISA